MDGCSGKAKDWGSLRRHFHHRHVRDTLVILEEGRLPRCELCDMFVSHQAIRQGHQRTKACKTGAARKRQRHAAEDARRADEVVISACGQPLDAVDVFKYLGRLLSRYDNDWPDVYKNLTKARKRWGMVSRVLRRENANPRIMAMFYKAVVQSVLLYGSETWVITPVMLRALEGFHHRVARQLTGLVGRYLPREDKWVYAPTEEVLRKAGLFPMSEYLSRRQRRCADYVASRPIAELCRKSKRKSGSSRFMRWWDQSKCGLDE